jgi:hypothetical protein
MWEPSFPLSVLPGGTISAAAGPSPPVPLLSYLTPALAVAAIAGAVSGFAPSSPARFPVLNLLDSCVVTLQCFIKLDLFVPR